MTNNKTYLITGATDGIGLITAREIARLGDRVVARVDLKADRAGKALLVRSLHFENGADHNDTESALRGELGALADWLCLETVSYC